MERRQFIGHGLATGVAGSTAWAAPQAPVKKTSTGGEPHIERNQPGQPHRGKVLAAIQPHCDDVPIYAGGTVLKLIKECYTGILIRTSNDEMAGAGKTMGEVVLNNERDTFEVAPANGPRQGLRSQLP